MGSAAVPSTGWYHGGQNTSSISATRSARDAHARSRRRRRAVEPQHGARSAPVSGEPAARRVNSPADGAGEQNHRGHDLKRGQRDMCAIKKPPPALQEEPAAGPRLREDVSNPRATD